MKEWLEVRDFSQGMNQEDSIAAGDAPWDLRDIILTEKPEIRRRGGMTMRDTTVSVTDPRNRISGRVIAAERFHFVQYDAIIVVSSAPDLGKTFFYALMNSDTGPLPAALLAQSDSVATEADICSGWSEPTKKQTFPDAAIITSNVGTWLLTFESDTNPPSESNTDFYRIARDTIGFNSGGTKVPLSGAGYRACASVGPYSFLGGRVRGGLASADRFARSAGRTLWWSALEDSTSWRDTVSGKNPAKGGSLVLPLRDRIRALKTLENNLVIFTRGSIHTFNISADQNDWSLRERATIGTPHPKSIARYQDTFVFANNNAVYIYSGYEVTPISEDSIGSLYRSFIGFSGESRPRPVVGWVWGDYYVVSNGKDDNEALCCHLPTLSWSRLTNFPFYDTSPFPNNLSRTLGYRFGDSTSGVTGTYIMRCDTIFEADSASTDSIGLGPYMRLELRRLSPGGIQTPKLWRSLTVHYDSKALVPDPVGLQVSYTASPDKDDAVWTNLSALPKTNALTEVRQTLASINGAIGVRIEEAPNTDGQLGKISVLAIELGFKELRRGRV